MARKSTPGAQCPQDGPAKNNTGIPNVFAWESGKYRYYLARVTKHGQKQQKYFAYNPDGLAAAARWVALAKEGAA